jgi:hypothetical protein
VREGSTKADAEALRIFPGIGDMDEDEDGRREMEWKRDMGCGM